MYMYKFLYDMNKELMSLYKPISELRLSFLLEVLHIFQSSLTSSMSFLLDILTPLQVPSMIIQSTQSPSIHLLLHGPVDTSRGFGLELTFLDQSESFLGSTHGINNTRLECIASTKAVGFQNDSSEYDWSQLLAENVHHWRL